MPSEGSGTATTPDGGTGEVEPGQQVIRPAGLMTASAWNDNQYYDYFKTLFEKGENTEKPIEDVKQEDTVSVSPADGATYVTGSPDVIRYDELPKEQVASGGKFYGYYSEDKWGFDATHRVTVKVTAGENVVQGAKVSYYGADQSVRYAVTDANGVAYIFPDTDDGELTVSVGEKSQKCAYSTENDVVGVDIGAGEAKCTIIKLMFVVDVTGSMGDEISYLTNELADVINRVASVNDGIRIDLAFLFYRDNGDTEKFVYNDFVDVTDKKGLEAQQNNLSKQFATGGGDYPEALDEALDMAVGKNWGSENSTKIMFHIFDAPPHSTGNNKSTYEKAIRKAAEKGIRYNPVLCSGADLLCEYLSRVAAIHTGGQFIYVTDDSGIGNAHYDPDIPNAVVERLNDLMVRLINGYYTGKFAPAVYWKTANAAAGVIEYTSVHLTEHSDIGTVAKIIDSVEGVEQTEQEILSHFTAGGNSQYYCPTVREKLKSYDETFFATKKLVYVSIVLGMGADRTLRRVYSENGKLIVEIVEPVYPDDVGFVDVITAHVFFIEMDNSVDVSGVEVKSIKQAVKA